MAFVAPVMRWPDAVASHLPQPLKDTGIPAQYFVIVPATLLAVILTYTLTKASAKVNAPHLASLVSAHSDYTAKRSQNRPSTVVLVGLSDAGKTSLFASLVYGSTPATVPSQTMSQGVVSTSALSDTLKPVTVVDLPGHARLRPLVDEHLHQADGLVICVDAVTASKASTPSTRPAGDVATITDVADLIHSTLTTLAKQRARSSTNVAPPCVLVLFTRADLSPLLGGSAAGTDAAKDEKRRAQLLARCKTTLEAELGQRRANMGFGRRKTAGGGGARNVSIAGLGKVADADPGVTGTEEGVFGWVKRALGLAGKLGFGGAVDAAGAEDEDDDEDEVVDYIDWAASQRVLNSNDASGAALGAPILNLNKLDDHVVFGGKVEFALASVGKERSWSQQSEHAGEGKEPGKKADASGGLDDFKRWIADLQS